MLKRDTTYFERTGPDNTDRVLELVRERSDNLGISTVVLASTRGGTAEKAMNVLSGKNLVIVGIDKDRFSTDILRRAEDKGFHVIFSHETDYHYAEETKAAFRRFSQGMKVAVEDVVIACLRNVLEEGVDVISLAGSSWGADTAIVINSAPGFRAIKIREVICMPR